MQGQVHVELSAVLVHLGPWWPVSQSDTTGLPTQS